MRVLFILLSLTMTAGAASASSFIAIAPVKEKISASMVVIGAPAVASAHAAAPADAPDGIDPVVTLSYPFADDEPPSDITIIMAPGALKQISPSVLAMDTPAAPRRKAAIEEKRQPFSQPIVFRGGIAGDAFATPGPVQAGPGEPAKPASAPEAAAGAKPPERPASPTAPNQPSPEPAPSPSPALPTRAPE